MRRPSCWRRSSSPPRNRRCPTPPAGRRARLAGSLTSWCVGTPRPCTSENRQKPETPPPPGLCGPDQGGDAAQKEEEKTEVRSISSPVRLKGTRILSPAQDNQPPTCRWFASRSGWSLYDSSVTSRSVRRPPRHPRRPLAGSPGDHAVRDLAPRPRAKTPRHPR